MYPGNPTNHSPEIYSAILGFVFSTDRIYEKEQNIQVLEANIQWELINSSYKAQNEFYLTLQFNSWPKSDHPTLTFLRKIAQTCRPGGPPSFL